MKTTTAHWALLAGMLVLAAQPALARSPAAAQAEPATVSAAIPITATSHPFLDAADRLQAAGYVEEEFILSGKANVYQWTGKDREIGVVAGPADYATRILVWRPGDARKFSGNIEVTVLNASGSVDAGRPTDFGRMTAQGDVWIGITTKAVAANALKRFDPVRYAPLRWDNPAPVATRCLYPSIIPVYMAGGQAAVEAMAKVGMVASAPETEDGLVWDMLGQLGQLLKGDQRMKVLPGFGKPRLFMTGVSQSSLIVRTFAITFHDRYRMPDHSPVYDGYLGVVGPSLLRLNQCEPDVPLGDPRQKFTSLDVPFISLLSEGEMWQGASTRQPDVFTGGGGWVTYEVAGGSHGAGETPGLSDHVAFGASPQDMAKTGVQRPPMPAGMMASLMPAGAKPNRMPWAPLARGAYHNLQLWVRQGTRPPQAQPIALEPSLAIRRDEAGNAIGGLRMPYIDVPTASHTGYLTAGGGMGGVMGAFKPFQAEELTHLYPTPADYLTKFDAATDRLVAGRWISPEDGEAMKKAAKDTPMAN